ncbi:MAG TPA: hypothetical protein VJQ08_03515 [Candidatus Dormibacteraeota bacterium]|nr:hypothetical protein [Candidatus Dormibacteraeota bacterium]
MVSRRGQPSSPALYTRRDLEPLSFEDLPLGGEWTTRRRTVSDAEIALFAGLAGDLSPLTIEAADGRRTAPPALVVAMAVGLGSVDTPVPSVAEWEWLNWHFPRAVHGGETIYARWTLTQKRPPVSGSTSSIVVWRVDVHTADGALCAEGEIGAKVTRSASAARTAAEPGVAGSRRRRRRSRANGGQAAEPQKPAARAAGAPKVERGTGPSRRRRRRRSAGSGSRNGDHDPQPTDGSGPSPAAAAPAQPAHPAQPARSGIGGVLRRLRGST